MMRSSFLLWILCFGIAVLVVLSQPPTAPVESAPERLERADTSATRAFESPGLVRALDAGEVWLRALLAQSGEIVTSYVRLAASDE